MLRNAAFSAAAMAASVMLTGTAAAQGYTTRIETRPFYGAIVTLEEGVRVIRPLPPERQVIINPDGRTPLYLGFNDTHVYENRVVRNYNSTADQGAPYGLRVYGSSGGYGAGIGGVGHMSHLHVGDAGPSSGPHGH